MKDKTNKENNEDHLYLRCYDLALKSSKWWWSDKRINEMALIMMMDEVDHRLKAMEYLLSNLIHEQKRTKD